MRNAPAVAFVFVAYAIEFRHLKAPQSANWSIQDGRRFAAFFNICHWHDLCFGEHGFLRDADVVVDHGGELVNLTTYVMALVGSNPPLQVVPPQVIEVPLKNCVRTPLFDE